jgi:hypothetical protein
VISVIVVHAVLIVVEGVMLGLWLEIDADVEMVVIEVAVDGDAVVEVECPNSSSALGVGVGMKIADLFWNHVSALNKSNFLPFIRAELVEVSEDGGTMYQTVPDMNVTTGGVRVTHTVTVGSAGGSTVAITYLVLGFGGFGKGNGHTNAVLAVASWDGKIHDGRGHPTGRVKVVVGGSRAGSLLVWTVTTNVINVELAFRFGYREVGITKVGLNVAFLWIVTTFVTIVELPVEWRCDDEAVWEGQGIAVRVVWFVLSRFEVIVVELVELNSDTDVAWEGQGIAVKVVWFDATVELDCDHDLVCDVGAAKVMVEFDSTVEVTYDRDAVSEASITVKFDLSKFEETDELNKLIEVVAFSEVVEFSEGVEVCV